MIYVSESELKQRVKKIKLLPEGMEGIAKTKMTKRVTISFSDDVVKLIDDWRKTQEAIPSFNTAVNTMLKQYHNASEILKYIPLEIVQHAITLIPIKKLFLLNPLEEVKTE